jgi:hypothetical protein
LKGGGDRGEPEGQTAWLARPAAGITLHASARVVQLSRRDRSGAAGAGELLKVAFAGDFGGCDVLERLGSEVGGGEDLAGGGGIAHPDLEAGIEGDGDEGVRNFALEEDGDGAVMRFL